MASPSIFGSVTSWNGSSPIPRFTRSAHSPNSCSLRALASESMGCRCCTGANPPDGAAPTRWVGESAVTSDGSSASSCCSSRISSSYSASDMLGSSST